MRIVDVEAPVPLSGRKEALEAKIGWPLGLVRVAPVNLALPTLETRMGVMTETRIIFVRRKNKLAEFRFQPDQFGRISAFYLSG